MFCRVKRAALEKALYAAFRPVDPKCPNVTYTGIRLDCQQDQLTATGTNIAMTITRTIPVEPGSDDGIAVVPGKKFLDLIKKIDHDLLDLETTEDAIVVKYGAHKATLKVFTFADNEFPIASAPDRVDYEMSAEDFASALKIWPFCYNGIDKPVLTGVYFNITPFGAEFAATDTHRVAVSRATVEGNDVQAVIPSEAIRESINLLTTVRITIEDRIVVLHDNTTRIYSLRIAGVYPDNLGALFTGDFCARVEVNPKGMLSTLERISLLQEKDRYVQISLDESLELSFEGEGAKISEKIETFVHDGKADNVFNTKYLQEAIQMYSSSEKITIFFGRGKQPSKIEDENLSIALLPMLLK